MEPIRVLANFTEGSQVVHGYLVNEEVSIVFENRQVWLTRVKKIENDLFESINAFTLLGDSKVNDSLEEYAKSIIKHLMKMSLFDYIVQKHFYSDQDINFDVT